MKKLLYEYSDFFLIYCVMFTSMALSRAIPDGAFSVTMEGYHFAIALIAASVLFGYKKYSQWRAGQKAGTA